MIYCVVCERERELTIRIKYFYVCRECLINSEEQLYDQDIEILRNAGLSFKLERFFTFGDYGSAILSDEEFQKFINKSDK